MASAEPPTLRGRVISVLAIILGIFIFYTSFSGPFESLVQRGIFVGIIATLGVLMYPLWPDSRLRPLGIAIDAVMVLTVTVSVTYIIVNFERIMTELPWATTWDMLMGFGTLAVILELSRRTSNLVFPKAT